MVEHFPSMSKALDWIPPQKSKQTENQNPFEELNADNDMSYEKGYKVDCFSSSVTDFFVLVIIKVQNPM